MVYGRIFLNKWAVYLFVEGYTTMYNICMHKMCNSRDWTDTTTYLTYSYYNITVLSSIMKLNLFLILILIISNNCIVLANII